MAQQKKKTIRCVHCGIELNDDKFFKSNSQTYAGIGKIPICKECLSEMFTLYLTKYKNRERAMLRLCMSIDIPYDAELFSRTFKDGEIWIGGYFRGLNLSRNKTKTFDDSLEEQFDFNKPKPIRMIEVDEDEIVSEEDMEKWGFGLDPQDYNALNAHYKYLKSTNPNCDSNQEIFINELCYTKMQQMKAVRDGKVDDYNKLTESYRKSFQQAGLKTVRDASEVEDFTIGIGIETIEKYTPAEYYKDKKMYEDFDNLGDYFRRAVLRPLRNAFLGTNDRDDEYYIKSDGDDDE